MIDLKGKKMCFNEAARSVQDLAQASVVRYLICNCTAQVSALLLQCAAFSLSHIKLNDFLNFKVLTRTILLLFTRIIKSWNNLPLVVEASSCPAFKNKLVVHLNMQIDSI